MPTNDDDAPLIRDAADFEFVDGYFVARRHGRVQSYLPPAVLQKLANNAHRALREWHEAIEGGHIVRMGKPRRKH